MKKTLFGMITILCLVMLSACANEKKSTADSTIDSLKKENATLSSKVKVYEDIFGAENSSESSSSDSNSTSETRFPLGKALKFQSGEEVTVENIKQNKELQLNDAKSGEIPVVVTVMIENSTNSPISINPQYFSLYDTDSQIANFDSSSYGNDIPNSIAAGMKATFDINYSSKGDGPYTVSFGDALWIE